MLELTAILASITALGDIGFFIFGALMLVAFILSSKTESFFMGVASLIVGVSVLNYVFNIPVIATVTFNPILSIVAILVYISLGTLYAGLYRVKEFLKINSKYIIGEYESWKSDQIRYDKEANISYDIFIKSNSYSYSIRKNKDRVASWVLLWPLSVTWKLINDPITWLIDTVYYGLGHILEKINHEAAKEILTNNNTNK